MTTERLNAFQVRNWRRLVAGLESGRFIHGTGYLEIAEDDVTKNCCIGVDCRLARVPRIVSSGGDVWFVFGTVERDDGQPAERWLRRFGADGFTNESLDQSVLTDINDSSKSYKPVIRHIKKHLAKLGVTFKEPTDAK